VTWFWSFEVRLVGFPYELGVTIRTMTLVSSIKENGYDIFIQETMSLVSSIKTVAVTFSSKKQRIMESFGRLIANVGSPEMKVDAHGL
jgi:hypothetical protein